MEDYESVETVEKTEELEEREFEKEEAGVSFDDIVSFTMLLETTVTLTSIIIFFFLFVL